jgi:hypothetical protein
MVDQLRKQASRRGRQCGEPAVLIQAHIAHATMLVIATPDTFHVRAMIETARALNPTIMTVVRTHSEKRRNCCARKTRARCLSASTNWRMAWPSTCCRVLMRRKRGMGIKVPDADR